jgi:uncharacterized membrane protein YqjE
MDETRHESGGWLATGKRILRTIYGLAQTRVELFLVELQEERIRLFDALLLVSACVVCSFMALALLTLTVVVIFWEQHRILVLVLLTLTYAVGAGWSYWRLRRRLAEWQSFSATVEEFKKDQACLEKPN